MIFLSEMHLNKVRAELLREKVKMDRVETVESVGASDGLLLLWCQSVVIHVSNITKKFIDVTVDAVGDEEWRFTG